MAQRYVRVHSQDGKIYYGLLQLSQNVEVLDAPPKGLREGWEPRLFRARGKAYPCGFNRFQYSQP